MCHHLFLLLPSFNLLIPSIYQGNLHRGGCALGVGTVSGCTDGTLYKGYRIPLPKVEQVCRQWNIIL